MFENVSPRHATNDYNAKTSYEAGRWARHALGAGLGPFGDPLSGIVLVAESPAKEETAVGMADALRRSLAAVKLDEAYVTWPSSNLLEEILSLEPGALVAIGPAARAIDDLGYPLVRTGFSEAPEGSWFAWTRGTLGLRLPALAPALTNAHAKRRFWQAFLALRVLARDENS